MKETEEQQRCALCGVSVATTSDHVPPKNIFPKPRPNDLITVPSCFKCNNIGSKYDEEFRVFLSLQIGMENLTSQNLWKKGALRSLHHNRRLRRHILDRSWEVDLKTPAGIYLGKQRAVPMPARPHNAVLDRTVRGLYFYHFGEILGPRVACHVKPLTGIPQEISPTLEKMSLGCVGGRAFCYRYGRAVESPLDSLWLLLFYEQYPVLVETKPKTRLTLGSTRAHTAPSS
jgi:hypothetical protein